MEALVWAYQQYDMLLHPGQRSQQLFAPFSSAQWVEQIHAFMTRIFDFEAAKLGVEGNS